MTDNRIIASPMLDRNRVADAIQRGVHLELHPVYAKAALHGVPVELTTEQAFAVADVALEALAKTHPDGKTWLIKANEDWRWRNDVDRQHWKIQHVKQAQATDRWRATALNAYVLLLGAFAIWEWHWPRWSYGVVIVLGFGGGAAFRYWLSRRERHRAGACDVKRGRH